MREFNKNIMSKRIRKAVLDDGRSVIEIACQAKMPYTSIYEYMNGKKTPTLQSLVKLCIALDVSADYILFG